MFQAKFVMMSGIGHTSKIILKPLMEHMYQLKFFYKNKYHILVEKELLLRMLWLFVIFGYVSPLFGLDGKALHMIHIFFLEAIQKE
jgi:hypothetical protein